MKFDAKTITGWLKAHWPIPVCTLVAIVALPTAWYFATDMSDSHKAEVQKAVTSAYDSVSASKAKVSYFVPGVDGGKVLEKSSEANPNMIEAYQRVGAEVQKRVGEVTEKGLTFNKGEHGLLLEGLLAQAETLDRPTLSVKTREFMGAYIELFPKILKAARAGTPPAAEGLMRELTDFALAAEQKKKAETGADLDAAEKTKLTKELADLRIARYRQRAQEIGVYADLSCFDNVPREVPNNLPTVAQLWDMQERAWVQQDVFRAITAANGGPTATAGVPESLVKRVAKVTVGPASWDDGSGNPKPHGYEPGEDKAPVNYAASITGRVSGPATKNRWYDLRKVTLEVVASSQRLPAFFDALAATNFITVTDVNLAKVDITDELKQGYFYGSEHVVRATLTLETIWLREWRKDLMPVDVRKALGMVEGVQGEEAPPAAAPPPRPRPGGPAGRPAPGGGGGRPGRPSGGDE